MEGKLRILQLPIAFVKDGGVLKCYYTLYPIIARERPRYLMDYALRVAETWKSGLWVIGRGYRAFWDALFKPSAYSTPEFYSPSHLLCDKRSRANALTKSIYDLSDRVVWKWSSNAEETFLKSLPTSIPLQRGRERYSMPINKVSFHIHTHLLVGKYLYQMLMF